MKWIKAKQDSPKDSDNYHVKVLDKDGDGYIFPAVLCFTLGMWEVAEEHHEVIEWLDESEPVASPTKDLTPAMQGISAEDVCKALLNIPDEHMDNEDESKLSFGIECYNLNRVALSDEDIIKLSYNKYPVLRKKDADGEWYDTNEYKRQAFVEGLKFSVPAPIQGEGLYRWVKASERFPEVETTYHLTIYDKPGFGKWYADRKEFGFEATNGFGTLGSDHFDKIEWLEPLPPTEREGKMFSLEDMEKLKTCCSKIPQLMKSTGNPSGVNELLDNVTKAITDLPIK